MATAQQLAYIAKVTPYAKKASAQSGIPVDVLIIQSGVETGWGTSQWFRDFNNPAGIGVTGAAGAGNSYPNLQAGFNDYAAKLLGKGEAGQEQFVTDLKAGASTRQLLADIEASPWAAGHYGGTGLDRAADDILGKGNPGLSGHAPTKSFLDNITSGVNGTVVNSVAGDVETALAGGLFGAAAGNVFGGLSGPAKLATAFFGLFTNWRYVAEVFVGLGMIGLGTVLVLHDMNVFKAASQQGEQAAKVAAVAA